MFKRIRFVAVLAVVSCSAGLLVGQPAPQPGPGGKKFQWARLEVKGRLSAVPVKASEAPPRPIFTCITNHTLDNFADFQSLKSNFASFVITRDGAIAQIITDGKAYQPALTYWVQGGKDFQTRDESGKVHVFRVFREKQEADGSGKGWAVERNPEPRDWCQILELEWKGNTITSYKPFQVATGVELR